MQEAMVMSAGLPSSAGASAASTAAPAQTALPRGLVDAGVRVSAAALLAPANCRAPEKTPPSQQTPASVTREHLHLHLRSAPRRAQERVDLLPAHGPCQALAPLQGQRPARANPALAENPRAPARSERSPACRPLGGRSHQGRQHTGRQISSRAPTTPVPSAPWPGAPRVWCCWSSCLIPIRLRQRMYCGHSATSSRQ